MKVDSIKPYAQTHKITSINIIIRKHKFLSKGLHTFQIKILDASVTCIVFQIIPPKHITFNTCQALF